jgi:bacillithiol biosynthesis deacetylase BshB1
MILDILAFGVHPDDVELCAAGTLLKHMDMGYAVGIIDLTHGELGTRGSAETRMAEAQAAAEYMGIKVRENLGMPDGFVDNTRENCLKIIRMVRKYRPDVVLANAISDRHPDHARAAELTARACYLSGLQKIETDIDGAPQPRWRPKAVYHYIQDHKLMPDFCIDITHYHDRKMEAVKCYASQFYDPGSEEPSSPISGKDFLHFIEASARIYGRPIGVEFGEGFMVSRPIGVDDVVKLF